MKICKASRRRIANLKNIFIILLSIILFSCSPENRVSKSDGAILVTVHLRDTERPMLYISYISESGPLIGSSAYPIKGPDPIDLISAPGGTIMFGDKKVDYIYHKEVKALSVAVSNGSK